MATPSKAEQEAEGKARLEANLEPGIEAQAADSIDNDEGGPREASPPPPEQPRAPDEPPLPTVKQPFQNKRDEIVGRFRTQRQDETADTAEDVAVFTRNGMPQEFQAQDEADDAPAEDAAAPEPEADAAAEGPAAPPQAPAVVRVKVNHEEKDIPLEELIRHAQKSMAADNILDKAKDKLSEVDELLRTTKDRATRVAPAGDNRARPEDAQNPDQRPDPAADPHHGDDDPIKKIIETIQFGDPEEAGKLLRTTISEEASKAAATAVDSGLVTQRLRDEGARTNKVLKEFKEKHADLASDPMASAAIERRVLDLQREDLEAIGVDLSKLQTATPGVVSPDDIAMAHRFYRANGFNVKKPDELLTTAIDEFNTRFGKAKPTEPTPPAPGTQPRVVIDRTVRRQAIPQQPNRPAAPRPAVPPAPPQARDRSSIVTGMKARRDLPRGRVVQQ